MTNSKALTQIPMGAIKKFIEENFEDISFSEQANIFFEKEFLGDIEELSEIIALKDGNPEDISKWLVEEYDIKLEMKGDYAIATVLFFSLEFLEKAKLKTIECESKTYNAGRHKHCMTYKFRNGKTVENLYQLNLKEKEWEIFVSESNLDKETLNDSTAFDEYIEKDKRVHLTVPMVNYKEELDFSKIFQGSSMIKKADKSQYKVEEVKTVTLLDLGLDKIEVKQVAEMTMTRGIDMTRDYVINDDFFVYVFYNKKLAFASKMLKEDFIKSEDLK